ncbi:hypothetical protein [Brachybacterium aquaticum]|uniref:Serine/threonine protein kinase n=1 Tax=Brachybacterium aquaticum TaxID=1432564 RepID=A0A841AIA4_9MICO|nr:hypothetical protein [Brachybacterium aquaticum]MBB5832982.1 hypothetical protein [Brachybacterium aquaticum]
MNASPEQDALSARWTLEGRIPLSGVADGAEWCRARSVATGEGVVLFIVRGEAALEAADAVRRAYLVEDPRLLPVQEIVVLDDPREDSEGGEDSAADGGPSDEGAADEGPTTVVQYPLPPAPPLAALLGSGPLHPETARAIIGEAAQGLEAARRRGVRHQFLDSNRVFVDTRSGAVTVLGVGVEAAAHPGLDRSRETASFQDTAALVALLYRALTGRTPQPGEDGVVPRPSTVVDIDIPADLDLLCELVLNETDEDVPETTRGLIEALEPWQSIPVTLEAYPRGGRSAGTGTGAAAAAASAAGSAEEGAVAQEPAGEQAGVDEAGVDEAESLPEDDTVARPVGATDGSDAEASADDEDPVDEQAREHSAAASEKLPEDDTVARPVAGAVAGAAAGAGVAGAAAVAAQDAHGEGGDAAASSAASAPSSSDAPESDPTPTATTSAPTTSAAAAETSREAKALVDDLHLNEKRSTSPFPGRLDIVAPVAPVEPGPAHEPADEAGSAEGAPGAGTQSPSAAPAAAGAALAGGAAAGGAVAGGAAAGGAAADEDAIPSATSGTQWTLSPARAPQGTDGRAEQPPSAARAETATADHSAPTPDAEELAGAVGADDPSADDSATVPVAVSGRTVPMAQVDEDRPIVVQGRRTSLLDDAPEESTVPLSRGSLLRDVVGVAVDADDPDTFTMGPRDEDKRSLQSQWIIVGGVIVVMFALVFAITAVTRDLREIVSDPLATSQAETTEPPAEEDTGEAPVEPTPTDTETPELPAPEVSGIELFAQGSDNPPDNADQLDRMTDGDPATFWSTQHYASPDYGGLKEGVGVRIDFAEPSQLTTVTVTTARNNGGTLELRAVNDDGSLGDVLDSGELVGDGEMLLQPDEPVDASAVALYIPELPADSNEAGRFRARIAEIRVE